MQQFKHLPIDHTEQLSGMVTFQPNRVVSMALSQNEHCQMTLLAFADKEGVSEESYPGDTFYYVLEGEMPLRVNGACHLLGAGDCMAVPAGTLHAVGGGPAFKLLQITVQ